MAFAALLLLVALGVLAAFFFAQRSLLYLPQYTHVDPASTDFELRREGATLRGWVLNPDAAGAPILYFGGNAESVQANRELFARWFAGRTVYLLAYRGYGASDGEPSQDALFGDALAFYDDIARRHPGQPVSVIGRSLGSGVASYLASQRPVARLALVTPFDSVASVAAAHYPWLPVRLLLRDRYDSVQYLRAYRGPLLVVRAGRDQVVPPANTDRLLASLPPGTQVVAVADTGHELAGAAQPYGQALAGFFESDARLPPAGGERRPSD